MTKPGKPAGVTMHVSAHAPQRGTKTLGGRRAWPQPAQDARVDPSLSALAGAERVAEKLETQWQDAFDAFMFARHAAVWTREASDWLAGLSRVGRGDHGDLQQVQDAAARMFTDARPPGWAAQAGIVCALLSGMPREELDAIQKGIHAVSTAPHEHPAFDILESAIAEFIAEGPFSDGGSHPPDP